MKTNLENLTSLLCECEELNSQIKQLKFGCQVLLKDYLEPKKITLGKDFDFNEFQVIFTIDNKDKFFNRNDIEEIIGNPIEYHHLMIFAQSKGYAFAVGSHGKIIGNRNEGGSYTEIQLDYLKPLSEQSEETLGKIFNFLKG